MSNKRTNQPGERLSKSEREQLDRLEAKRRRFEGDRNDSKTRSGGIRPSVLITVGAIALAVVFVFLFAFRTGDGGGASAASAATLQQVAATTAAVESGKVTISMDEVKTKKLVYWDYKKANGQTTALMAYVTPSGAVKMAVRLCEPCNGYTFHIEGNQIVCNTCGTRWDLETSKGVSGGCQGYPPDVLKSTIDGSKITVDEATVSSWKARI
jgi:uncharacterized membrane protein